VHIKFRSMKLLTLKVEEPTINVEMEEVEHSVNMPVTIDQLYNVIVCDECGIGLPFEWIMSHLKDNHGIKAEMVDVMRDLNMMKPSMTLKEAKEWIKSVRVAKAMQNVPVRRGVACNICQHCTSDKKAMGEHFSHKHRGLKTAENSQECTVQMPFRAELRKYIQVNEYEDEMMREEEEDDGEGWNKTLEEEFEESIGRISISGTTQSDDLRLMGAFIARTRWDLAVKDLDKGMLIQSATAPTVKDKLHKIILCGRRYIQQCCERISNGNVMIRRLLMSVGYIDRYLLV
jgi:Orsellinic acid/F9775 biosynthesis cluster protein D